MFYSDELIKQVVYYLHFNTYFRQVCNYKHQWRWHNNIILCFNRRSQQFLPDNLNTDVNISKKINLFYTNFYGYSTNPRWGKRKIIFDTFDEIGHPMRIDLQINYGDIIYYKNYEMAVIHNDFRTIERDSNGRFKFIQYNARPCRPNRSIKILFDCELIHEKYTNCVVVFLKYTSNNFEMLRVNHGTRSIVTLYKHFPLC
jgi:hypothetical protein